jgi:hypothetical protein
VRAIYSPAPPVCLVRGEVRTIIPIFRILCALFAAIGAGLFGASVSISPLAAIVLGIIGFSRASPVAGRLPFVPYQRCRVVEPFFSPSAILLCYRTLGSLAARIQSHDRERSCRYVIRACTIYCRHWDFYPFVKSSAVLLSASWVMITVAILTCWTFGPPTLDKFTIDSR